MSGNGKAEEVTKREKIGSSPPPVKPGDTEDDGTEEDVTGMHHLALERLEHASRGKSQKIADAAKTLRESCRK